MREIMKARKKDAPIKPPAVLEERVGDFNLPGVLYLACKVFARLSAKPSTAKFPGTLVLRQYRAGQVICWQGDPGWTAFSILSDDDLHALHTERDKQLAAMQAKIDKAREKNDPEALTEGERLQAALAKAMLPPLPTSAASQPPAKVYFDLPRSRAVRRPGLLERIFGRDKRQPEQLPRFIPIDPSTLIDYRTRTADMPEGRIFGEWSCMYGTPRSATIVAERDCYVLEMLRNVLDTILGDKQFQADTDEEYVKSVLANHLAGLSIFEELTAEQFAEVRSGLELKRYRDGDVIFDRDDPADAIYIVRRGLVKVQLNDWPLLTLSDIADWKALAALNQETPDAPEVFYVCSRIPAEVRLLLGRESLSAGEKKAVLNALNTLLRDNELSQILNEKTKKREPAAELRPLLTSPDFKSALAGDFAGNNADWADRDWRRFNRLILESLCPGALRTVRMRRSGERDGLPQSQTEEILTYHTKGEFFGEMGVMLNQPRSATCVAYVHPRPDSDQVDPVGDRWRREEERVELVKVPAATFRSLCDRHPALTKRVADEIRKRKERSRRREKRRRWEDSEQIFQSDRFQEMGLIQGQKLMLIDLDRCTRCDECVEACVNTHNDGRSRLFLDGPRFDRYLVPTTCRACRDPVCLIGCPVGSIRRGDNLDIIIENWCIGCQQCAKNCPYGSIQMHDQGILPEEAHNWRVMPAGQAGGRWHEAGFSDHRWHEGATPFIWEYLKKALNVKDNSEAEAICFRRTFTLEPDLLGSDDCGVKIVIRSAASDIEVEGTGRRAVVKTFLKVWLNGQSVDAARWNVGQDEQFGMELLGDDRKLLHAGRNVIAIQATPRIESRPPKTRGAEGSDGFDAAHRLALDTFLQVAIDEIRASGAVLPLFAVVCDQCSSLGDARPACVRACPHDAAMRVDAPVHFFRK